MISSSFGSRSALIVYMAFLFAGPATAEIGTFTLSWNLGGGPLDSTTGTPLSASGTFTFFADLDTAGFAQATPTATGAAIGPPGGLIRAVWRTSSGFSLFVIPDPLSVTITMIDLAGPAATTGCSGFFPGILMPPCFTSSIFGSGNSVLWREIDLLGRSFISENVALTQAFSVELLDSSPAAALYAVSTAGGPGPATGTGVYRIDSYRVNPSAVLLTVLDGFSAFDIAIDPRNGTTYLTDSTDLYTLNLSAIEGSGASPQLVLVGSHGLAAGQEMTALEVGPDGTIYGGGRPGTSLYTLSASDGSATTLFDTGFPFAGDVAYDPTTDELIASHDSSGFFRINLTTQTATFIDIFDRHTGLEVADDGFVVGSQLAGVLYSIDESAPRVTFIGDGFVGAGLALPEPGISGSLAALFVIGWLRRTRSARIRSASRPSPHSI